MVGKGEFGLYVSLGQTGRGVGCRGGSAARDNDILCLANYSLQASARQNKESEHMLWTPLLYFRKNDLLFRVELCKN